MAEGIEELKEFELSEDVRVKINAKLVSEGRPAIFG